MRSMHLDRFVLTMPLTRPLGFTLIELLVTLSVLVILLAVAIPGLQPLARNNRLTALTNDLISTLNVARSEAVKRGVRVTVCKSANSDAAAPVCNTGADWHDGWLVFVDNSGTIGIFDGTDVRLKVGQPASRNATITADTAFANFVSYVASGASSASANMVVCLDGVSRTISINTTGRIQTTPGSCA